MASQGDRRFPARNTGRQHCRFASIGLAARIAWGDGPEKLAAAAGDRSDASRIPWHRLPVLARRLPGQGQVAVRQGKSMAEQSLVSRTKGHQC
ncbi:hypothetical protein D3C76_1345210 [compost metagenome]